MHVLYGQPDHLSTSYQTTQLMHAARAHFAVSERRFADRETGKYKTQIRRLWSNFVEPYLHQPEADFVFYGNDGFADLRKWKSKSVVYWYDAPWDWTADPPTPMQRRYWLRYQNVRSANYVLAVSHVQVRVARALRPGREASVRYLPVGVDCTYFSAKNADAENAKTLFRIPRDHSVIGYLGYIAGVGDRIAGQPLIDAASQLIQRHKVHFLIVGFGPALIRFKEMVKERGLAASFTFTGYISSGLLPSAIAAMDICVDTLESGFHSEARSETKLKQYMAMGRACVATAIGENCVDLAGGECGCLVAPGNDDLWAGISKLVDNPSERERLGAAARKRALAVYDWPVLAREMADVVRT